MELIVLGAGPATFASPGTARALYLFRLAYSSDICRRSDSTMGFARGRHVHPAHGRKVAQGNAVASRRPAACTSWGTQLPTPPLPHRPCKISFLSEMHHPAERCPSGTRGRDHTSASVRAGRELSATSSRWGTPARQVLALRQQLQLPWAAWSIEHCQGPDEQLIPREACFGEHLRSMPEKEGDSAQLSRPASTESARCWSSQTT